MQRESEYKTCTGHHTKYCGSPYQKNKVPIEMFIKDGKILKTCFHCRNAKAENEGKRRANARIKPELIQNTIFYTCSFENHRAKSMYPKNKVPIEMLRKIPDDPDSPLYDYCSDCREYKKDVMKNRSNKIVDLSEKEFRCKSCLKIFDKSQRFIKNDGSFSSCCTICREKGNNTYTALKMVYKTIKREFIEKMQCCCNICQAVFITNKSGEIVSINTFEYDGSRYLKFEGNYIKFSDFIKSHYEEIEIDILEFDHLLKLEMINMGLLNSEERYEPKIKLVGNFKSEYKMRKESKKCQLLCGKCHISITMFRNKETTNNSKRLYTDKLKECGCSNCGYKNNNIPRFFHFDHINPRDKGSEIADMVNCGDYTIYDVMDEIKKCRILCLNCHKLHTRDQRRLGII